MGGIESASFGFEPAAAASASPEEWNRALSYLRKYADNSLAYLALEPDKEWLFSENPEGMVSFARSGIRSWSAGIRFVRQTVFQRCWRCFDPFRRQSENIWFF